VKTSATLLSSTLLAAVLVVPASYAQTPPEPPPAPAPAAAPQRIPGQTPSPLTPPPLVQPLGIATQPAPPVTPVPASAGATETAPPQTLSLTLAEAIRGALGEGSSARLARSAAERAEITRREALSGLLPQASASLMRYNESLNLATFGFSLPGQPPVIGPFNVTDAQITAAVQLFNLAALRRFQSTRAGVEAGRYQVQQAENDVVNAVGRLYVLIQRADAQVASRQADLTLFDQLARVANDELQAGTGTRLDVAQAHVQRARAREALLRARNDRDSARLALLSAIGADQSSELVLAEPLGPPPATPGTSAAIAAARAQRPELKQLEANEQAAKLIVDAARARYFPTVALDFQGDLSGPRTDDLRTSRRIAGVVSVPLFRGDIPANVARAKLELEDARTRRTSAERDVEQQVRASLLTLQNAQARAEVAGETVTVAEEALQISRDRKSSGYGSSVEVDRAEDAYRQAHEDLIAARADAAMAWLEVQHATGSIRDLLPPRQESR
jgi:outer membrane protein TolC